MAKENTNFCLTCDGNPSEVYDKCASCGFREEHILAEMAGNNEELQRESEHEAEPVEE